MEFTFKRKMMVAGPTEIEKEVREAGSWPMVYNRTPEFSEFILDIEEKLKVFFRTRNDVFIMASSGTGAMEAAVINVLSKGDEVIIVSGGTFGHRWYEIASRYGASCRLLHMCQGESIKPNHIKNALSVKTRAVFVTANETSTGVVIDLEGIGKEVEKTNAILVVDAVSSMGADVIDTDKWCLDVVITSSQKALALPPGLSFISVSNKAWKCVEISDLPKYYFDLKFYRENICRGQTPFTPPVSLLYQLSLRLNKYLEKGADRTVEDIHKKSLYLRKGLKSIGLEVFGQFPSNGVTGILFPANIDASEVVKALREKYLIEIAPSPGKDKRSIARIGLFGDVKYDDIDRLLSAIAELVTLAE